MLARLRRIDQSIEHTNVDPDENGRYPMEVRGEQGRLFGYLGVQDEVVVYVEKHEDVSL